MPGDLNLTDSAAMGVNGDGSVIVGRYNLVGGGDKAFRWTSAGGVQNLGTLGSDPKSTARAVNSSGSAIVGWSGSNSDGRAFRWTQASGLQSLGTIGADVSATAVGVSGDGLSIVGWSGPVDLRDPGGRAFLWTPGLGMVNLNTYLPSIGVDLAGWTLLASTSISADGNTMVGVGNFNGLGTAWLVTIPSPCTAAVMGVAGLGVARRRRAMH